MELPRSRWRPSAARGGFSARYAKVSAINAFPVTCTHMRRSPRRCLVPEWPRSPTPQSGRRPKSQERPRPILRVPIGLRLGSQLYGSARASVADEPTATVRASVARLPAVRLGSARATPPGAETALREGSREMRTSPERKRPSRRGAERCARAARQEPRVGLPCSTHPRCPDWGSLTSS